ncbi:phenylalanine--tRNA ligase subunit beta [Acholeplasma granularum]|uniref:phenylalanine--tRNA ligase subunit beta n=1 Tax=Acholeplasma granularum TaxID=264635 RepID=UPI00046E9487|nr:phenylalanine--tRNA ligase subunit beta [Acholeplasma granularum]
MFILENILKNFIKVPSNLYEVTNQQIIEVDAYETLNSSTKLVVGHVLECVKHPNSDHLSLTKVNIGSEVLSIVCGAKNVDKGQYVIVAQVGSVLPGNFEIKEATVRGEKSLGMICSLTELGFDEKYIQEEFKNGIFYFDHEVTPGTNGLEALGLHLNKLLLGLTPNRGDLLSHLGFAYDLASMLNIPVTIPKTNFKESNQVNNIDVVLDTNDCHLYNLRVMDVTVKESPIWLKNALIQSDIRPINNVVDITNYILITYGTPLHAFDFNKVNSSKIVVRNALDNEVVETLDEVTRNLQTTDIVITNGEKPIALGGVMGLNNSSIDNNTTKIMLEAALFNKNSIAQTSKRLNLRSDSSLRFERGVESSRVLMGLEAATQMLVELADAMVYKNITSNQTILPVNPTIEVNPKNVNRLLGTELTLQEIINYLTRLNYKVNKNDNNIEVQAPDYRKDIEIEADVIEEILRVYGYHHIENKKVQPTSIGELSTKQKNIRKLKNMLSGFGLNEVINYSLVSQKEIKGFPQIGKNVEILMPLSDDRHILRQSLIPGLLKTLNYHLSRQITDLAIFETGHVFAEGIEQNNLAILLQSKLLDSSYLKQDIQNDFYVLKGLLDKIGAIFNLEFEVKKSNESAALHPGIQGTIYLRNQVIGIIGKTHPLTDQTFDIKDCYVLEINLDFLNENYNELTFEQISKYPSLQRDISFVVSKTYPVSDILAIIKQTARKYLTNIEVFDVYEGENVETGSHSVAISMTFNDPVKTLEKQDIEKILKSVQNRLEFNFKAVFRA